MSFKGVKINKQNGGLGRRNASTDAVMALVVGMPTTGTTVQLNKAYKLLQVSDAEALGVNASFDANNGLLAHNEVNDFFTYCPDGTLFLIPTTAGLEASALLQEAALKATIRSEKDIKSIGVIGATSTVSTLINEVETVQAVVNAFALENNYIDAVILEGKASDAALTISNYPDLRAEKAPNVSVSIAQDLAVASLDAAYAKNASVGAVLGMLAVRQVNENLGSVDILNKPDGSKGNEDYPLTVLGTDRFAAAALSDGTPFDNLTPPEVKELTSKGYIFAGAFNGYGGIFFNGSPTCVEKASDYAYIENNRVWNKAARLIRITLIPKVKGVVKKDPTTGFIKATTISAWQGLLNKAMETMVIDNEISGFDFYINPQQTLTEDSPLKIEGNIVIDSIVFEFEFDLGLTDKL